MTTIQLYGGPLKRTLIIRAFGLCGQSVTESELTPEEMDLGLMCMNSIAATFPTLDFNYPINGTNGDSEEESGIPAADVQGFIGCLAQEIGPNIGKTFVPNGPQAGQVSSLRAKYTVPPMMEMGRQTIRGQGNRFRNWPTPYFNVTLSDEEVVQ